LGHWAWCSFSSARLFYLVTFLLLFFISFVLVAWDGYDTKVFGGIYFCFFLLGILTLLFSISSNDVIRDSLFFQISIFSSNSRYITGVELQLRQQIAQGKWDAKILFS
jgi:hypothetical protein